MTTKKRETLILNVDGCIAACFVDLLRSCGAFTQEEVRDDTVVLKRVAQAMGSLPRSGYRKVHFGTDTRGYTFVALV